LLLPREVTTAWLKELGADTVINHHKKIKKSLKSSIFRSDYIVSLNGTEQQADEIVKVISHKGNLVL
jgi:D-arabinose 1-dehydrogenase-like Zn-dependent alcohol dehydrogenase